MYIVGRSKELIIRSGFNVYPIEVETALNSHPDVVYAAVIGRRVSGDEEIVACIELKPGLRTTAGDLVGACRRPPRTLQAPAAHPHHRQAAG